MESLGQIYCNLGMLQFDNKVYDASVSNLIKAYELGYEREAILDHLYSCFIKPNESEFQKNYAENSKEMT